MLVFLSRTSSNNWTRRSESIHHIQAEPRAAELRKLIMTVGSFALEMIMTDRWNGNGFA
jgi:hypothetical protein